MSAHPTAGVPIVTRRPVLSSSSSDAPSNVGNVEMRSLPGVSGPSSSNMAPTYGSAQPNAFTSNFGGPESIGNQTSSSTSGPGTTAADSSRLRGYPSFATADRQYRDETNLLMIDLHRTDADFDATFQRVGPAQIVGADGEATINPVLYTTKHPMNNMKLKITLVPQAPDEFLLRRPKTAKGALLMLKAQQEKAAILADLARVRAEHERLLRNQGSVHVSDSGRSSGDAVQDSLARISQERHALEARVAALIDDDSGSGLPLSSSDTPETNAIIGTFNWQEKIYSPREFIGFATTLPYNPTTEPIRHRFRTDVANILMTDITQPTLPLSSPESSSSSTALAAASLGVSREQDLVARAKQFISHLPETRMCTRIHEENYNDGMNRLPLTTSDNQSDTPLAEIIRRRQEGKEIDPTADPSTNPVTTFYIMAATSYKTDLPNASTKTAMWHIGDEHVLCRIRSYGNGSFDMYPPLSPPELVPGIYDPAQWYTFKTPRGQCYRYRIELASAPPSERLLAQTEDELVSLLLKHRHDLSLPLNLSPMDASAAALVKAAAAVQQRSSTSSGSSSNTSLTSQSLDNQSNVPATASALLLRLSQLRAKKEAARREQEAKVREALARIKRAGTDFTSGPSNGTVRYTLFGEIVSLEGFESDYAYVEYRIMLPNEWNWSHHDREKRLGGITHTSRAYFGGAPSFRSIKKGKPHTFKAVGSMQGDATTRKDRVMIGSNDNDLGDNEDDLDQQDTNAPDYRYRHKHQSGELWCCSGGKNVTRVHHIGHPLEAELSYTSDHLTPEALSLLTSAGAIGTLPNSSCLIQRQPLISFAVYSVDWADRHTMIGCGFTHLPRIAGSHTMRIDTWRPVGSIREEQAAFFLGGGARLSDIMFAAYPDIYTQSGNSLGEGGSLTDVMSSVRGRAGGWQDMVQGGGSMTAVDVYNRRLQRALARKREKELKARMKQEGLRRRRGGDEGREGNSLLGRIREDENRDDDDDDDDDDGKDDDNKGDSEDDMWLESTLKWGSVHGGDLVPGSAEWERRQRLDEERHRWQQALGTVRDARRELDGEGEGDEEGEGKGEERGVTIGGDEGVMSNAVVGYVRKDMAEAVGGIRTGNKSSSSPTPSSSSSSLSPGGRKERARFQSKDERTIFFNRRGLTSEGSGSITVRFNIAFTLPESAVPRVGGVGSGSLGVLGGQMSSSLKGTSGGIEGHRVSANWHLATTSSGSGTSGSSSTGSGQGKGGVASSGLGSSSSSSSSTSSRVGSKRIMSARAERNWRRVKKVVREMARKR